jgi:hypothetical protein
MDYPPLRLSLVHAGLERPANSSVKMVTGDGSGAEYGAFDAEMRKGRSYLP